MQSTTNLDLHALTGRLAARLPSASAIHLFGSRRFKTGSPRSDIDLLLEFSGSTPSDQELAELVRRISVYLDVFVIRGGLARSAINGSVIEAASRDALVSKLDAVTLWTSDDDVVDGQHSVQPILDGWVPIYTVAHQHGDPTANRRPIDYLVVTALGDEFVAMQHALRPYLVETSQIGTFGRHLEALIPHAGPNEDEVVIVCQSDRMGNVASALTTAEALTRWAPRLVVLVGITGGLADDANIGDVVVASHVYDYESGKATDQEFKPHGVKLIASFGARQRLFATSNLEAETRSIAQQSGVPIASRVLEGGYASGEKVVANRNLASAAKAHDRKIIAIEMESLGVADACRRSGEEFMVLKAVTDHADRDKSDDYRSQCCAFASRLAVWLMRDRILVPPRQYSFGFTQSVEAAAKG